MGLVEAIAREVFKLFPQTLCFRPSDVLLQTSINELLVNRILDLEALAKTSENEIKDALVELNKIYETSGRSFLVAERSKGWKIYTRADYAGFVKLLFPGRKPERLSPPAMETLAIIAYRQPVTKSALEAVRGVSCDGMLQKLLDRELVKISGRADLPGRPLLYATTELFLEHFGITDIEEPNLHLYNSATLPTGITLPPNITLD